MAGKTPNKAASGEGSIESEVTLDRESNTDSQNSERDGHYQNIWYKQQRSRLYT